LGDVVLSFINFLVRFRSFVFALTILLGGQAAWAATLSGVDVDRTASLYGGSGALSATANGISITAFGPSVTEITSGISFIPSIILDSTASGSVSFTSIGFPPSIGLGGAVEDFRSTSALIEVLFKDTASGGLFVADIVSPIISGSGLALNLPQFDPAANITVYSAISPIPLPAAGWLFVSVLFSVGCFMRRVRRT